MYVLLNISRNYRELTNDYVILRMEGVEMLDTRYPDNYSSKGSTEVIKEERNDVYTQSNIQALYSSASLQVLVLLCKNNKLFEIDHNLEHGTFNNDCNSHPQINLWCTYNRH